jgi:hypothetical protein
MTIMRPIHTIATALLVASLAVAGCQRSTAHTSTATPTPTLVERATPPTTASTPAPAPDAVVGLWPVRTLAQARSLQTSVDAGHQPWLLSAESVAIAYAQGELHLFAPYAQQVGPGVYQVRSHHGEWEATVYLAQPVRHDNGVWVVTRVGDPVG